MRPQPLICVRDVEASSQWYQRLLGSRGDHGGPNYERLVHSGRLVLQLHRWWGEHHHGRIGDPDDLPPGNGLLLWFEMDDRTYWQPVSCRPATAGSSRWAGGTW